MLIEWVVLIEWVDRLLKNPAKSTIGVTVNTCGSGAALKCGLPPIALHLFTGCRGGRWGNGKIGCELGEEFTLNITYPLQSLKDFLIITLKQKFYKHFFKIGEFYYLIN